MACAPAGRVASGGVVAFRALAGEHQSPLAEEGVGIEKRVGLGVAESVGFTG